MGRTAVALLSTKNLIHNVQIIKSKIGTTGIIAMVKANAYGHGIRSVSMRLEPYVSMFGVASIDEAIILRKVGIQKPVVLMEGVFEPAELEIAAQQRFHVVFHTLEQIEWLEKSSLSVPLVAWLKVNTGMGRLGVPLSDAHALYERIHSCASVQQPVNSMSHFACADIRGHWLNEKQKDAFKSFVTQYPHAQHSFCNSAALFSFSDCWYDYVRPGLALYGISPFNDEVQNEGLKPVMTLQSSLIAVMNVKKGDTIGYGARYVCNEDMRVGVVAFGYGDGYPITARDGTPVLIRGVECPLVGRVSMDMMTVDIRACAQIRVGDTVTLWGEGLPVEHVVKYTDAITWSLITGIQNRVKFVWN